MLLCILPVLLNNVALKLEIMDAVAFGVRLLRLLRCESVLLSWSDEELFIKAMCLYGL